MTRMTKQEYLAKAGTEGMDAHRAYFGQFVTYDTCKLVLRSIGLAQIQASTDPHFNDIPLQTWDGLVSQLPRSVATDLEACGDWLSLGTGVCILKECARWIKQTYESPSPADVQ